MKKLTKAFSVILAFMLLVLPLSSVIAVDAEAAGGWTCSWATSTVNSAVSLASLSLQDIIPSRSTIRIEFKVTTGGEKLRFKFSNEHGAAAVIINAASVGRTQGEGQAQCKPGSMATITFGGQIKGVIPAGKTIWSDEINYTTNAMEALSVSLYFDNATYITSAGLSNARTYLGMSSLINPEYSQCYNEKIARAREINLTSSTITYHTTPFLCEVDTYNSKVTKNTAVFIGDSTLVNDAYLYFAEKLVNAGVNNVAVVNEAIVANKLLSDGTGVIGNLYGDALVDRFEKDALSLSGVKWIFVKIGLNDVLHQFSKSMGADVPHYSASQITDGYKKLVEKAHAKGIKVYFFTKTPWKGYERAFLGQEGDIIWNQQMQNMCNELDKWIKNNNVADGYIDCWSLENPANKYALCPSFTPDGAHLTDIGAIALADLIPVSFVGVNKSNIRTCAQIHNVDPYKEKNQIIYDMEHPTQAPSSNSSQGSSGGSSQKPSGGSSQNSSTGNAGEESTTKLVAPDFYGGSSSGGSSATQGSSGTPAGNSGTSSGGTITSGGETVTMPEFNYVAGENVTVPVIGEVNQTQKYTAMGVSPDYSVLDNLPESRYSGASVLYVLILFTVVAVAGAFLFVSLGRKKEEDFE